jgi:acetyl esterase/lipase
MKKNLLSIIFSSGILVTVFSQQQRYVDEVFTNFTVEPNITYCQNYSVIAASAGIPLLPTGVNPAAPALAFDLYEPDGDTVAERPLIIMLGTGTFLPIIRNGNPTGMRQDFATTQICKSFAKRGYVVANLEYRRGWNPTAPTQAERAASIMKAVFRAMQDTKSAGRFFRKDYAQTNQWGIDTSRIILCGQGSGGWVALGYASVDKLAEIQLPKFLDDNAVPLIDTAVIGDWNGYGGTQNMPSNLGFSNDIHMVCNMGGAMGDLSWLEAGDVPMVSVHCPTDPIATYTTGTVSIALIGTITTDISGSYDVTKKANLLGNNDLFDIVNNCNDPYTTAAAAASINAVGIVIAAGNDSNQIVGDPIPNVFPYNTGNLYESSPWDFWDSTTTVNIALAMGLPASAGTDAHMSNIATNPNMSLAKSTAYIDTTLGYFTRRIVRATNLITDPITINQTACDSYTWNGETYTTSGNYQFVNANCLNESLNLTITQTPTTTISACDTYTWIDNDSTTYNASGTYYGDTTNCGIETLILTINVTPAAAVVTELDGTLTATGGDAGLGVWVDCATQQPFMETAGMTTFTPDTNGVYTYVILNATMTCYGIGNCVQVTNVSLGENDQVLFSIAPNPSNGIFTLKNPSLIDGTLVITDGSGRIIYESSLDASEKSIDISNVSLGIYYLNIKSENNNKVIRLIKN